MNAIAIELIGFHRSTRNTRIERLWVEVGTQFARRWRAFFTRLENLHRLDRSNPAHLWLLHFLFLEPLNKDCEEFQIEWNLHPMAGSGPKGRSPQVSAVRSYDFRVLKIFIGLTVGGRDTKGNTHK